MAVTLWLQDHFSLIEVPVVDGSPTTTTSTNTAGSDLDEESFNVITQSEPEFKKNGKKKQELKAKCNHCGEQFSMKRGNLVEQASFHNPWVRGHHLVSHMEKAHKELFPEDLYTRGCDGCDKLEFYNNVWHRGLIPYVWSYRCDDRMSGLLVSLACYGFGPDVHVINSWVRAIAMDLVSNIGVDSVHKADRKLEFAMIKQQLSPPRLLALGAPKSAFLASSSSAAAGGGDDQSSLRVSGGSDGYDPDEVEAINQLAEEIDLGSDTENYAPRRKNKEERTTKKAAAEEEKLLKLKEVEDSLVPVEIETEDQLEELRDEVVYTLGGVAHLWTSQSYRPALEEVLKPICDPEGDPTALINSSIFSPEYLYLTRVYWICSPPTSERDGEVAERALKLIVALVDQLMNPAKNNREMMINLLSVLCAISQQSGVSRQVVSHMAKNGICLPNLFSRLVGMMFNRDGYLSSFALRWLGYISAVQDSSPLISLEKDFKLKDKMLALFRDNNGLNFKKLPSHGKRDFWWVMYNFAVASTKALSGPFCSPECFAAGVDFLELSVRREDYIALQEAFWYVRVFASSFNDDDLLLRSFHWLVEGSSWVLSRSTKWTKDQLSKVNFIFQSLFSCGAVTVRRIDEINKAARAENTLNKLAYKIKPEERKLILEAERLIDALTEKTVEVTLKILKEDASQSSKKNDGGEEEDNIDGSDGTMTEVQYKNPELEKVKLIIARGRTLLKALRLSNIQGLEDLEKQGDASSIGSSSNDSSTASDLDL